MVIPLFSKTFVVPIRLALRADLTVTGPESPLFEFGEIELLERRGLCVGEQNLLFIHPFLPDTPTNRIWNAVAHS